LKNSKDNKVNKVVIGKINLIKVSILEANIFSACINEIKCKQCGKVMGRDDSECEWCVIIDSGKDI